MGLKYHTLIIEGHGTKRSLRNQKQSDMGRKAKWGSRTVAQMASDAGISKRTLEQCLRVYRFAAEHGMPELVDRLRSGAMTASQGVKLIKDLEATRSLDIELDVEEALKDKCRPTAFRIVRISADY